jgi:hypothetical protein
MAFDPNKTEQKDDFKQEAMPDLLPKVEAIVDTPNGKMLQLGEFASPNFKKGSSGWILRSDGSVEFGDGIFRGRITASSITTNQQEITVETNESIQAAINELGSSGGTIRLKAGTYVCLDDINIPNNVMLLGQGMKVTILYFAAQNKGIKVQGTSNYSTGTVTINNGSTSLTGAGGTAWLTNITTSHKIRLNNYWYDIASIDADNGITLSSAYIGFDIAGATYDSAVMVEQFFVEHLTVAGSAGTGIYINYGNYFFIRNVATVNNGADGLSINNSTSYVCEYVNPFDNGSDGIYLNQVDHMEGNVLWCLRNTAKGINGTNIFDSKFNSMLCRNNEGGAYLDNMNDSVINASDVSNNTNIGLEMNASDTCFLISNEFQNNGSDGIKLTANCDNIIMSGNAPKDNGGYGINIAASTDDDNILSSNIYSGNTLGEVNDSGTNTQGVEYKTYFAESVSAGDALSMTITNFASATTALNFGKVTSNEKGAFMVYGNGMSMSSAKMALKKVNPGIAFDASAEGTATTNATLTFAHTCTGNDLILIVAVVDQDHNTTGVTYNGVAMTAINNGAQGDSLWYLVGPATGSNNVVVTRSGAGDLFNAASSSYTGVDQSSPIDSSNTGNSLSRPLTITTTVVASGCWLVGMAANFNAGTSESPITSNKTTRKNPAFIDTGAYKALNICDTNGTVATGNQSIEFTGGGTITNLYGCIASINPKIVSDNYIIRIETDNAGEPSGNLADANATATVAGSGLTTSFVDTTVTFAGSFMLVGGTKYWVTCSRSGALNNSAYYSAGYLPSTSRLFNVNGYSGATWTPVANSVGYINGSGFTWITKTQANLTNSSKFFGFAEKATTLGSLSKIMTEGILTSLTGLDAGSTYYISDTAGLISTSEGTTSVKVGKALTLNRFLIINPPL